MFYTMALIRVLIFFLISVLGILPINAVEYILRPSETVHLLSNFQNDVFTNSSLSAPFYRGVVTGAAWAMPASAFDLGGRSMTCECFDPDEACCMPQSKNVAPFCIPKKSTCCSDTFCKPGEKCCGDACCPSDSACAFGKLGVGCCPKGQICFGSTICYDHSLSDCSKTFLPLKQCCPQDVPYCRYFKPHGKGCYQSSVSLDVDTIEKASSTFSKLTSTTTITMEIVTTSTETITLKGLGSNEFSLVAPSSVTPASNQSIATAYVIESFTGVHPAPNATSSLDSQAKDTSTSAVSPSSDTTSISALCFNLDKQSPLRCSPTTPPPAPAASTFRSASSPRSKPARSCLLVPFFAIMSAWALCTSCFCGPRDDESEHWEVLELRRPKIDKASIQKVEGSERVLRGRLGQEISVVEGSGRKVTGATPAAQETDAITPAAQETDAITPAAQETDAITPVARET